MLHGKRQMSSDSSLKVILVKAVDCGDDGLLALLMVSCPSILGKLFGDDVNKLITIWSILQPLPRSHHSGHLTLFQYTAHTNPNRMLWPLTWVEFIHAYVASVDQYSRSVLKAQWCDDVVASLSIASVHIGSRTR